MKRRKFYRLGTSLGLSKHAVRLAWICAKSGQGTDLPALQYQAEVSDWVWLVNQYPR
jgi:hypothetical protein